MTRALDAVSRARRCCGPDGADCGAMCAWRWGILAATPRCSNWERPPAIWRRWSRSTQPGRSSRFKHGHGPEDEEQASEYCTALRRWRYGHARSYSARASLVFRLYSACTPPCPRMGVSVALWVSPRSLRQLEPVETT